jgi:hypothetical protein
MHPGAAALGDDPFARSTASSTGSERTVMRRVTADRHCAESSATVRRSPIRSSRARRRRAARDDVEDLALVPRRTAGASCDPPTLASTGRRIELLVAWRHGRERGGCTRTRRSAPVVVLASPTRSCSGRRCYATAGRRIRRSRTMEHMTCLATIVPNAAHRAFRREVPGVPADARRQLGVPLLMSDH